LRDRNTAVAGWVGIYRQRRERSPAEK